MSNSSDSDAENKLIELDVVPHELDEYPIPLLRDRPSEDVHQDVCQSPVVANDQMDTLSIEYGHCAICLDIYNNRTLLEPCSRNSQLNKTHFASIVFKNGLEFQINVRYARLLF